MKKKSLKGKLNLSKKTVSNLDKSGVTGGFLGDSVVVDCIVSVNTCAQTCNCDTLFPDCADSLVGATCNISCNGNTCDGAGCPPRPH